MTGQSTNMRMKVSYMATSSLSKEIPELNEEDATGLYYLSGQVVQITSSGGTNGDLPSNHWCTCIIYGTTAHTKQGFIVRPPLGVINHEYLNFLLFFMPFLCFNSGLYCGSQASIPAASLCLREVPETDKGWP